MKKFIFYLVTSSVYQHIKTEEILSKNYNLWCIKKLSSGRSGICAIGFP